MQKENSNGKQEMSFSGKIKEELARQWSEARHCQIAELAAIISMCGKVSIDSRENYSIKVRTENVSVARKYFTLLKKTFNIRTDVSIRSGMNHGRSRTYIVAVREHEEALKVLQAVKLINSQGEIGENLSLIRNVVLQNACCRRAFIRGAFLAAGSISAPEKFYHFEIVCPTEPKENIRIVKEMRGSVNRQVNCETANINKTVSAAVKQIEDIRFIQSVAGLSGLPESLQEMARIRLERPEATLKELGEALEPPVGKSGVNHRLRKLSLVAEELRQQYPDRNTSSLQ